ncbi:MAG: phosphatase PAP2 family protein [Candidatus Eisenbacteria bacterium]|nr:phosphatase PAP2 family protein [Candidatus Eisenbacteria bacterium]
MPFAYPAEQVLGAYLILAGISTLAIRPPGSGMLAGGLFIAGMALFVVSRLPSPRRALGAGLRAVAPLLLYPLLYPMTGTISRGLPVWILDGPLERLEAALFGGQPSMFLADAAAWRTLSEILHACYFSYYFLVIGLPFALALQGRPGAAARAMGVLCACFSLCLLCYIWIPVTSPLYLYPPLPQALRDGFFYRLTHAFASRGGVIGGAFPSSHAALSVCNLVLAFRLARGVFWCTLAPTVGLLVATVYGRYHFALDTVAGVVVGMAFAWWAGGRIGLPGAEA